MSAGWVVLIAALWVAAVALSVVTMGLMRRLTAVEAALLRRPAAPRGTVEIGSPLRLGDVDVRTLAGRSPAGSVVLCHGSTCGPCQTLAGELRETGPVDEALGGVAPILLTDAAGRTGFDDLGIAEVLTGEGFAALGIPATPYAVAIDPAGIVRAKGVARTVAELVALTGDPAAA